LNRAIRLEQAAMWLNLPFGIREPKDYSVDSSLSDPVCDFRNQTNQNSTLGRGNVARLPTSAYLHGYDNTAGCMVLPGSIKLIETPAPVPGQ
jgi:hypothetical protein